MNCTSFNTSGYHGYNVKFSPFDPKIVGCCTSQNYGLAGRGALFLLNYLPNFPNPNHAANRTQLNNFYHDTFGGRPQHHVNQSLYRDGYHDHSYIDSMVQENQASQLTENRVLEYQRDGLFDFTFSEVDPNIIWAAGADGSILVYDLSTPHTDPVFAVAAHEKEIYSMEWSTNRSNGPLVLTSSWDSSIKTWDGIRVQRINRFLGHEGIVYAAVWSPRMPHTFASVGSDGTLKIWDMNDPSFCRISFVVSPTEVLSCDWCKYQDHLIFTSAVDGILKGWDIRSPGQPVYILSGHERAVKKIKFSPFEESLIASVSYDFTTRIWDFKRPDLRSPLLLTLNNHREFVYGLDFSLHLPGVIADCGWDQKVIVASPPLGPALPPPPPVPSYMSSSTNHMMTSHDPHLVPGNLGYNTGYHNGITSPYQPSSVLTQPYQSYQQNHHLTPNMMMRGQNNSYGNSLSSQSNLNSYGLQNGYGPAGLASGSTSPMMMYQQQQHLMPTF